MSASLRGRRVAVAGAGVFGLSIAALAARRGAAVVVFDPAPLGDNASGVAAGMLSPVFEALLEDGGGERFALFERAYAAWPAFAASLGLAPLGLPSGGIRLGEEAGLEALTARFDAMRVRTHRLSAEQVRARQPLYGGERGGILVQADSRLDPAATLAALAGVFTDAGGVTVPQSLDLRAAPATFDHLVVAAGYDARGAADIAPELTALSPIKGHILHFAVPGLDGPTLRADEGYLVPQAGGVAFGATMEPGTADRRLDPQAVEDLRLRALGLAPGLQGADWRARTGVRASTPDGLPLVGVATGGAILAVGARRNGWLLAPLVARAAVEALEGAAPWPAFDPARFRRS